LAYVITDALTMRSHVHAGLWFPVSEKLMGGVVTSHGKNSSRSLSQVELAKEEKCEFIPFQAPKQVILKENKIAAVEFCRTEQDEDDRWVEDVEQITRLRADFIISAFGSGLYDLEGMPLYMSDIIFLLRSCGKLFPAAVVVIPISHALLADGEVKLSP
jgi:hypothetical protein